MTVVRHIIIDGSPHLESEISKKELEKIYEELSQRPMETLGCRPAEKMKTA